MMKNHAYKIPIALSAERAACYLPLMAATECRSLHRFFLDAINHTLSEHNIHPLAPHACGGKDGKPFRLSLNGTPVNRQIVTLSFDKSCIDPLNLLADRLNSQKTDWFVTAIENYTAYLIKRPVSLPHMVLNAMHLRQ